ncbi:hypothetical protein [Ruegeria hyattellae]|uniref:hypothetical protein n=1 Tax=Ruegeria hyattellae TaxID=3233337 RepID=UPI00355AFB53
MSGNRRWIFIGGLLLLVGVWLFLQFRTPPGTVPMGDTGAETVAWVGLATAVVGLATGVVSLVKEIISVRSKSK